MLGARNATCDSVTSLTWNFVVGAPVRKGSMAIGSESHVATRQLFMWAMACMYLFAFFSLYTQVPGIQCLIA